MTKRQHIIQGQGEVTSTGTDTGKRKKAYEKFMEMAKNVFKINLSQDMVESDQCPPNRKGAARSQ